MCECYPTFKLLNLDHTLNPQFGPNQREAPQRTIFSEIFLNMEALKNDFLGASLNVMVKQEEFGCQRLV